MDATNARVSVCVRPARVAARSGPSILVRMVQSRLFLIETLLGHPRAALRARTAFEETERSDVTVVELGNDLMVVLARVVSTEDCDVVLRSIEREFRRLGLVFGWRQALLLRLVSALLRGDERAIPPALRSLKEDVAPHSFLGVAEALARAAAYFALGQSKAAEDALARASAAIVGTPFVELDWVIELLRARLALRAGQMRDGRRHVHRSLHSRELLLQLVPESSRSSFLEHRRFSLLEETASRVDRTPIVVPDVERTLRAGGYQGLIGSSPATVSVARAIESTRSHDLSVLIRGESGAGKGTVATAIYRVSSRRRGPFQTVHCASLPEELVASELFGYQRGAFTGAEEDRAGILETLNGGTLLFDEVGELTSASQTVLLRAIETGTVKPLGGERSVQIDVRFLFSTSVDLEELCESGQFRADLYYRMRAFEIFVPPLRERRGDIEVLARHLIEKHALQLDRPVATLSEEARDVLFAHDWPGNVRELEAVLLRALVQHSGSDALRAEDLEPFQRRTMSTWLPAENLLSRDLGEWRRDLDREYLTQLFFDAGGNVKRMTERLGVQKATLYDWFRRAGIDFRELRKRLD